MKKKVLISIVIIVVILLVIFGYFIAKDLMQEEKLLSELDEINTLVNSENINIDEINAKLNSTITNGDYAIVEQAFKSYLKDSFNTSMKIAELLNDERITNVLTVENYKKDGKEFKETKEYINNTKEELEKRKKEYNEFLTTDKAMSYITDKGLDSYYTDWYRDELIGDMESEQDKTVANSIDDIIELLNKSEDTIDFLAQNKNNWQIEGENIVFSNENLSNKYNELLDKLTEEASEGSITYSKSFGSYKLPENWIESKEHSTNSKFFYVKKEDEQKERPNNISINEGQNKYAKTEHENFRNAILNQLSMQIGGDEDVEVNANGSNTENGDVVYTFNIKEADGIETTQYYIVGDYKYILIQQTVFEKSDDIDNVAKDIANSFSWRE